MKATEFHFWKIGGIINTIEKSADIRSLYSAMLPCTCNILALGFDCLIFKVWEEGGKELTTCLHVTYGVYNKERGTLPWLH